MYLLNKWGERRSVLIKGLDISVGEDVVCPYFTLLRFSFGGLILCSNCMFLLSNLRFGNHCNCTLLDARL